MGKQIILKEQYPDRKIVIKIDQKLLTIILENLLSNAVKYAHNKGRVTLDISIVENKLLVKVSDNGVGIPKNEQKNIFSKLFRASNANVKDKEGTGLGLYMVKSLVEQNKGKIWFSSKKKSAPGTTFYVELPLGNLS